MNTFRIQELSRFRMETLRHRLGSPEFADFRKIYGHSNVPNKNSENASMYCLACPEFQFDFIYEYASLALKVELRKLSRNDQSETEKVKQIVRMKDWLVARRFDFVRNYIRTMLGRGFRRQLMRTVIAELRMLRRQQGARRRFPAMILDRS